MNLPDLQPPYHPQLPDQRIAELADHLRRELRARPARSRGSGHLSVRRPSARILAGAAAALVAAAIIDSSIAPATELPPITHEIAAFSHPALVSADVPPAVEQEQARLSRTGGHGAAIAGEVRQLAKSLGAHRTDLYAFPTKGAVCLVALERTTLSTCVPRFDDRRGNVNWMIYSGPDKRQIVAGLMSDEVAGVAVVARGTEHPALLANNAYYWQAPEGVAREEITAIVAYQEDGSLVKINVDFD